MLLVNWLQVKSIQEVVGIKRVLHISFILKNPKARPNYCLKHQEILLFIMKRISEPSSPCMIVQAPVMPCIKICKLAAMIPDIHKSIRISRQQLAIDA
jgi:hypothetical protein